MNNKSKQNSTKKLRILRFSGVLAFVGTFIFAIIYTGDDQFLKRCLANGNTVKYCNDIYYDRNLAFKRKQLEKDEKGELDLSENRRKELINKDIKTKI